jgi:glycosyltransferase involved in cell wall biosynthesis
MQINSTAHPANARPPASRTTRLAGRPGTVRLLVDSSGIGGIERHIAVLAGALRRDGIDARVWLFADHCANPWLAQLDAAGVPYDINKGGAGGRLRRLIAEPTALLHTHGYKAGIIGRMAARVLGVPVVSTFHAGDTGRFPVRFYQRADERTSLLATRICVNSAIAARLPYSARVVANFIETPDAPCAAPLPATIGFVGRLSHEKGPDLFCHAAARGAAQAAWRMIGDGPMRGELEPLFGQAVEFRGMVTDMASVWPDIGLLLMPSRAEGLPMAALEALAAGVPVAAARVGALPELIRDGENGWLFEPGDLDGMARAVNEWSRLRAEKDAVWRRAAWATAREKFGVAKGLAETLQAYAAAGFMRPGAARSE